MKVRLHQTKAVLGWLYNTNQAAPIYAPLTTSPSQTDLYSTGSRRFSYLGQSENIDIDIILRLLSTHVRALSRAGASTMHAANSTTSRREKTDRESS